MVLKANMGKKLTIEKVVVGSIRTNCYIVKKEQACFIVDPGAEAAKIKAAIGLCKPKFILITHGHFDHVLALRDLAILYPKIKIYLSSIDQELVEHLSKQGPYINQRITDIRLDLKTLKDDQSLLFEGEKIQVMATAGHTFGSLCFKLNDNLFSGDTLFYHSYGRTDLPWSDGRLMEKSLEKLASLDDNVKVFPGHGSETSIREEKKAGVLRFIGV